MNTTRLQLSFLIELWLMITMTFYKFMYVTLKNNTIIIDLPFYHFSRRILILNPNFKWIVLNNSNPKCLIAPNFKSCSQFRQDIGFSCKFLSSKKYTFQIVSEKTVHLTFVLFFKLTPSNYTTWDISK